MCFFQGSYKALGCSGFAQENPAATRIWEALSSSCGLQGTATQNPFGLLFFHFFLSCYISLFFVRGWLPWTCPWTVMVRWPSTPPCSPWSELLWKLKLGVSMSVRTNAHTLCILIRFTSLVELQMIHTKVCFAYKYWSYSFIVMGFFLNETSLNSTTYNHIL